MRLHGGKLPAKKKAARKRLKPIIKRIVHPGQCTYPTQAKVLQQVLGWMDTTQYQNLAMDVVRKMHEMGYRIATKGPKLIIQTAKQRLEAQARELQQ